MARSALPCQPNGLAFCHASRNANGDLPLGCADAAVTVNRMYRNAHRGDDTSKSVLYRQRDPCVNISAKRTTSPERSALPPKDRREHIAKIVIGTRVTLSK